MDLQQVRDFCRSRDYDLRKTHNARWIDQKCTPDVVWSVADFVLDYTENVGDTFTVKDIWQSDYAKETIAETYSKPGTDENKARHEYGKVFSQPLCMLCYAGVLRDVSPNSRHRYQVAEKELLEFIARNDRNALRFLQCYIQQVLADSGLLPAFEEFFQHQDKAHFHRLKETFIQFYHQYTPIQGHYEPMRIFTKVLNPLAFSRDKRGTEKGRLSPHKIIRADMMYNRDNFRDVYRDKPKEVTRQEWLASHPEIDRRDGYFQQAMAGAKRQLRQLVAQSRGNLSELTMFAPGQEDRAAPTQVHHIFPKNEFPEIMHRPENMIVLTPNQHFGFAHPGNNTQVVDETAQKALLLAKAASIRQNLESGREDPVFDFSGLLQVLYVGWGDPAVWDIPQGDYDAVLRAIEAHYPQQVSPW